MEYRPTDAVVFAKRTLRCGIYADGQAAPERTRPAVRSAPGHFRSRRSSITRRRLSRSTLTLWFETRARFWDVITATICDLAIGRDEPWGYRESSFADGPNSVGLWLCEPCFGRYLSRQEFSFLVRILLAAEPRGVSATAGGCSLTRCRSSELSSPGLGGTVGGTGPRAGCSPSAASSPVLIASDAEGGWTRRRFVPTAISAATY